MEWQRRKSLPKFVWNKQQKRLPSWLQQPRRQTPWYTAGWSRNGQRRLDLQVPLPPTPQFPLVKSLAPPSMISEPAFDGRRDKPRIETLRQTRFAQQLTNYSVIART